MENRKLDGVAPWVADQPNANLAKDSDTHILSDIGDTLSMSLIWL